MLRLLERGSRDEGSLVASAPPGLATFVVGFGAAEPPRAVSVNLVRQLVTYEITLTNACEHDQDDNHGKIPAGGTVRVLFHGILEEFAPGLTVSRLPRPPAPHSTAGYVIIRRTFLVVLPFFPLAA